MINIDERSMEYPVFTDISMFNAHGAVYPAACQLMGIRLVEEHLKNIGMDAPTLMKKYALSWVLLCMSMELKRRIKLNDTLTGRTWHTCDELPLYRRELAISDAAGETVAVGTTFSALFDTRTHRLCTDARVLADFVLPDGEALMSAESRFRTAAEFTRVEERRVRSSCIDGLGHVNNLHYQEYAYDALNDEERLRLENFRRMDIWFKAELREGMTFAVQKAVQDTAVIIKGDIMPEDKPSFIIRLQA